jgi:hypothetical protein
LFLLAGTLFGCAEEPARRAPTARFRDHLEDLPLLFLHSGRCPSSVPLCALATTTSPPQEPQGTWVGLSLPCRDPDLPGPSAALRAAIAGDWSQAEISGMTARHGQWSVSVLQPATPEEQRELDSVRAQLVECLDGPCAPRIPRALHAHEAPPRPFGRDALGHLSARLDHDLAWEMGRATLSGRPWWLVSEHLGGTTAGCARLHLFPDAALFPE